MDDTQQSRVSDAAATRKRRSSILKSQRPARTPFSELEFNVATPTDTAKSRRVSFSRRTGVAEFVTNEATTTWKNFYEEHNKSLESSGNDSDVNATRQPVEHLGKRIFDQQFEEVEVVDFIGSLNPSLGNTSLNNINFTEQIASLECSSDVKLDAPRNNFELSALTDHQSKLFGNDFTVTGVGEMSGRIEVNFSTIQQIGEKDDLDDIERDLQRASNDVCLGPSNRHNMSEYIEVDLNMTHVVKSDDCDMSITDTVHSPKVQDVSKNCSIDKKLNASKDWVTDKENIAINPYAAPRETDNFAVNDEPNQVLVFDGKRLTLQTEKSDKEYRKTLLPNTSTETPQRKTIVLNTNDDLPNFVSDLSSKSEIESKHSNIYNDIDLSIMSHVNKVEIVPKRKTILDNSGNISITQALPSKIISGASEKRRTMVYAEEEANISMTQALPSKIISGPPERRRTMVYNEEDGNISMTQALPSNIIGTTADKQQSTSEVDGEFNISMTQALPSNIISGATNKRRTMVYDQEDGNISMTQALPSNIIGDVTERRRTVHDVDDVNISMTQALPSNIISGARRQTIVYDQDAGNISMTQVLPSNILGGVAEKRKTIHYDDGVEANISITQVLPSKIISGVDDKHKTMVYDQDDGNISMTQVLPANIISGAASKRLTMVYNDDDIEGNISMTQMLPTNIINGAVKRQTMVFEDDDANISITQALPAKMISSAVENLQTNVYVEEEADNMSITKLSPEQMVIDDAKPTERRRTVLYENDTGNISITQTLPTSILQNNEKQDRMTVIFDESNGNISITKTVAVDTNLEHNVSQKQKTMIYDDEEVDISNEPVLHAKTEEIPRTVIYEDTTGNISVTKTAATNLDVSQKPEGPERRRTVVFHDDTGNISVTQALSPNIIIGMVKSEEMVNEVVSDTNKRRTIVFENDTGDISVTQPIPTRLLPGEDSDNIVMEASDDVSTKSSFIDNAVIKNKTIIYEDSANDISAPESIYANIITPSESTYKDEIKQDNCDKSLVDKVPTVAFLLSGVESHTNIINKTLEDFSKKAEDDAAEDDDADNEMIFTESCPKAIQVQQSIQHNNTIPDKDTKNVSITRPIPANMSTLQDNVIHNLVSKQTVLYGNHQEVLFVTSDVEPRINSSESEGHIEDSDSNTIATSETHDIDVAESVIIKETSDNLSLLIKDEAGHVIESKLDVYNIQANIHEESMDVDKESDIQSVSIHSTNIVAPKLSVVDALLNMSELKLQDDADRNVSVSGESIPENDPKPIQESNESLFYIIREEDAVIQTEKENVNKDADVVEISNKEPPMEGDMPAIEFKELDSPLQDKLNELHAEKKDVKISPEKHDISQPEVENIDADNHKSIHKSFKNANDTKELLDMISDFTDKTRGEIDDDDEEKSNQVKEESVKENKIEPIRRSFAPNRQSIVFSREDLLNNISMAQAALQKSRIEIDDSEVDDTQDTFTEEASNVQAKSDRLSSEVVKTLHFDDESISGCSIKSDGSKHSPLRKTAFGETSYMKDNKANVIPSYLKDVTEGIKVLMSDLVKPMADVLPFDTTIDRRPKKTVSTVSTQIQANLVTSSQIDLDENLASNPPSTYVMENASSFCLRNNMLKEHTDSDKLISYDSNVVSSEMLEVSRAQPPCAPDPTVPGQVLIFDHQNPLNNILLGPTDYSNAHAYNPVKAPINDFPQKSDETLCGSERSESCQANGEIADACDIQTDKVTTLYNVDVVSPKPIQYNPEKLPDVGSNTSKVISEVLSTTLSDCKNAEVNTIIAMKENKELLNASSSLTLVDDASDIHSKSLPSPMRVVYNIEEDNTEILEDKKHTKSKKRNYHPSSLQTAVLPNVDITPKPKTKMQKLSNSPEAKHNKITPERDVETKYEKVDLKPRRTSPRKSKQKSDETMKSATVTVQHMITEYHVETATNQSIHCKRVLEAMNSDISAVDATSRSEVGYNSLDEVSSFTSSKNLHAIKRGESISTNMSGLKSQTTVPSVQSCKSGWHPDVQSLSSSSNEFDAGVNIVAKIDMLPFMGSHECEWESSTADTWCFRLLHSRIRLTVRLAHSHANAIKTRVRADTPVHDISVETVQQEKKNPVSSLCVRFACETMRYMVARARGAGPGSTAGLARGIPALLRRCAAAARVALRWGRAMHDAKLQLAYTLDNDGNLTLKVANIPLRSVWEVSMRIELVLSQAGAAPWPRATALRVRRVVADAHVRDDDVRRALATTPHDWGHAPRTIWRIFRYLKNKTRDDELLLGA